MRPRIVSGNKICQKTVSGDASLLGSFIEAYIASNPALDKDANFGTMTHASLEFARGAFSTCSGEYNWYEHFQLLMRHPVMKAGVQIAAWHHYRFPEDLAASGLRLAMTGRFPSGYSRNSSSGSVVVWADSARRGSQSDGSSFFGLFTRGEISHIRI